MEGDKMGLIMLFEMLAGVLLVYAYVIAIVFIVLATTLLVAIVLIIIGIRRPKGKRKWFFIPAIALTIPTLLVTGYVAVSHVQYEIEQRENRLYYAIMNINVEEVQNLLEEGVDPNKKYLNHYPLHQVSYRKSECEEERLQILELLLKYGADPDICETLYSWTLLQGLCLTDSHFNYQAIELLLEYGADPNLENPNGKTPLDLAKENNNKKLVDLLIEYGAVG